MNYEHPNTREVVFDSLRLGLQASIIKLWSVGTTPGADQDAAQRFIRGFDAAIKAYQRAWHYVDEHLPKKDGVA